MIFKLEKPKRSQKQFLKEISEQYKGAFIYGYGTYAKVLSLFLKKKGIEVRGFILDQEYISLTELEKNKEVTVWEKLPENVTKDFVIINGITKDPQTIHSKWFKLYKPIFIDITDFLNIEDEFFSLDWVKNN